MLLKIESSNTTLQIYAYTFFLILLIHFHFDFREINTGNDHVFFLFILEEKNPRVQGREPAVSMPSRHGPPGPDRRRHERPVSNPERHNNNNINISNKKQNPLN